RPSVGEPTRGSQREGRWSVAERESLHRALQLRRDEQAERSTLSNGRRGAFHGRKWQNRPGRVLLRDRRLSGIPWTDSRGRTYRTRDEIASSLTQVGRAIIGSAAPGHRYAPGSPERHVLLDLLSSLVSPGVRGPPAVAARGRSRLSAPATMDPRSE